MKSDETENNERGMRRELAFVFNALGLKKRELEKELEKTFDALSREKLEKQMEDHEETIKFFFRFKSILDEIISISHRLKDESLTDEERAYFIQKREELRVRKDENFYSEFQRRFEFLKNNPDLIKKKVKRKDRYPEGTILADPGFIKAFAICVFTSILIAFIVIWFF